MNTKSTVAAAIAATFCAGAGIGIAHAQEDANYAGVMGQVHIADKRMHLDNGYGGRAYYGMPLNDDLNLEFTVFGYDSNPNHKEYKHMSQIGGGVDLAFELPHFLGVRPAFLLGAGAAGLKGGGYGHATSGYANIGMSMTADITRRWSWRAEARGMALFPGSNSGVEPLPEDMYTDIVFGVGLQYNFIGEAVSDAKAPVQVVALPPDLVVHDADGDGVPDERDQCPDTPTGVAVDARGCPFDSDGDGVPDYKDQCPNTLKGLKVDDSGCVQGAQSVVLENVNFEFNKDTLTAPAKDILAEVAKGLTHQPGLKVEIGGHTDSKGSDAYNMTLSRKRAAAVRTFLVAAGVDAAQLTSAGYGESQPIASNANEEGRARNRRVEFKVLK